MNARISLLFLILATSACGGDDDGEAVDGAPQVDLSGEDILAELLDVDGEGSGLDADSIDGLESDELARAGRRSETVQLNSLTLYNGGLDEASGASMEVRLRIPPDAMPGEPIDLFVAAVMLSGAPCGVRLSAGVTPFAHDALLPSFVGEIDGAASATLTPAGDNPYEFRVTFPTNEDLAPGNWGIFSVARDHDHAQDTCTADFALVGVAFEYDGR